MPHLTPEAERVLAPLIRRAARFGPYLWLEFAACVGSVLVIEAATGSFWLAMAWLLPVVVLVDSTEADREHAVERWMDELRVIELRQAFEDARQERSA